MDGPHKIKNFLPEYPGGIVGQLDGDGISSKDVLCTTQKIFKSKLLQHLNKV